MKLNSMWSFMLQVNNWFKELHALSADKTKRDETRWRKCIKMNNIYQTVQIWVYFFFFVCLQNRIQPKCKQIQIDGHIERKIVLIKGHTNTIRSIEFRLCQSNKNMK